MLLWMNETTSYTTGLGKKAYIKCHCSTGQTCAHYKVLPYRDSHLTVQDPRTGQPLNFNYLPIFADQQLGIMPHTVQMYAYDDPAPTYGNANFSGWQYSILNYLMFVCVWLCACCQYVNADAGQTCFPSCLTSWARATPSSTRRRHTGLVLALRPWC